MPRTRILTTGSIDNDGVEFQVDESARTHTLRGKSVKGFGIYKRVRADDGVGINETLYDVRLTIFDAFTRFESLERQVKRGDFRNS